MNKRSQWIKWTSEQAQQAAEYRESAGRWEKAGDKFQAGLNDLAASRCEDFMETPYEEWLKLYGGGSDR